MGFNDILKKLFGNKAQRDLREIEPIVEQVKKVYEQIVSLSNDELRTRTETLKQQIRKHVEAERRHIEELRASIENTEIEEREKIYNEIDKVEKDITKKFDEILDEILPDAFAIMKDTARRFAESEEIEVTANDFDRDLAARYDFVSIPCQNPYLQAPFRRLAPCSHSTA